MTKSQAHIDISSLRQMTGNDADFLIEVLELIRSQSPQMLTQMQDSLREDELSKLGATAHKMKSTLHVLGNRDWVDLLKNLELAAKGEHNREASAELLQELQVVCDLMLDRIDDELHQLRSKAA